MENGRPQLRSTRCNLSLGLMSIQLATAPFLFMEVGSVFVIPGACERFLHELHAVVCLYLLKLSLNFLSTAVRKSKATLK
jgi:hypothetical protein